MVTKNTEARDRIVALIDSLPDEALAEVISFLEGQRAKSRSRPTAGPPYLPTPMGGLWRGASITETDIAEARRETWGRFADDAR